MDFSPQTFRTFLLVLLPLIGSFGGQMTGQSNGQSLGQTVQLPTYRVYSTNSTVSVPDGGTAYLGGNTTVRSGSNGAAVPILGRIPGVGRAFQNRAYGNDVTTNRTWVTARILDHREWDEATLAEARRNRGAASPEQLQQLRLEEAARFLTLHMGRASSPSQPSNVVATKPRTDNRSTTTEEAPLRLGTAKVKPKH
jgi:Flp pilus assembly secretin CpaC